MEREIALKIAQEIYARDNAKVAEMYEDEQGYMFTCETDGEINPIQPLLVIDDNTREYQAVNPSTELFRRFLKSKLVKID